MNAQDLLPVDDQRKLELLRLRSRRSFLGTRQGGHISLKKGHGIEFADHRTYERGDDPRHIDWGLYGRTDRLYVKRFQEEQDLRIAALIDATPSMVSIDGGSKLRMAKRIAAGLGYISLTQQDTFLLSCPGAFESAPYSGIRSFHRLLTDCEGDWSVSRELFLERFSFSVGRLKFPGVAVLLSDFLFSLDDFERLVTALLRKNLDCTLVQVLSPLDRRPAPVGEDLVFQDSESAGELKLHWGREHEEEYLRLLEKHTNALRDISFGKGIGFTSVTSDGDLAGFFQEHLGSLGLVQ